MLLKDMISHGRGLLSAVYSETEAREMVSAYFEDQLGISRHTHVLTPDFSLSQEQTALAMADFARMAAGEPLQYVTGKAYFYGRGFRVTPDVLIPRQETELLCRSLISMAAGKTVGGIGQTNDRQINILDLCTGSGCIAWTLGLEIPGSRVTAVDISDGALEVASSQDFSAEISKTGAIKPRFVKADVLETSARCCGLFQEAGPGDSKMPYTETSTPGQKFDIIVSNPPYVMDSEKALMRPNVLDHEPHLALFVPDDDPLKFYKAVAMWALELLADDGVCMVEINEALGEETARVFAETGFAGIEIVKDLHGKDRFVKFSR